MATPSVEIQFAQRLAANEKTTRDRALKKLRKYIRSRSTSSAGFGEDELIKLWKGLHYCMWMQDKPLLQEDLAVQITRLMFSFPDLQTRLTFFRVFLLTEAREWNGIDRLRLDKFMMLVRQMLSQTLTVLQQMGWTKEGVNSWVQTLHSTLLDPNSDRVPDSLAMHLADIFLTELARVGAEQLDSEKILRCLTVFDNYLQVGKRPLVLSRILSSVYDVLIEQTRERRRQAVSETETRGVVDKEMAKGGGAKRETEKENGEKEGDGQEGASSGDSDSGYDEDSQPKLKFDSELIADHLFQLGSDEKCSNSNRQRIYSTVKRLRDASSAALVEDGGEGEEYDPDEDLEAAVERLNKLNPVKRKKKKKKQMEEEGESEDDQEEEEVKKDGKKKNKRKLNESEDKGQEKAKVTSKDSKLKDQDTGSDAKKQKFDEKDSSKLTEANNDQKKKKRKRKKKKKAKVVENESSKTVTSSDGNETAIKGDNSVLKVDGRGVSKTGKESEQLKIAESKVSQTSDHSVKNSRKKRRRTQDKPAEKIISTTETEEIPSKKTKTEEIPSKTKSETDSNSSSSISKQLFKDKTPSKKTVTRSKKTETLSQKAKTPSKRSQTPSKKADRKTVESLTSEFDEPLKEGETEIWVPSKKYQKTKNKSGRTPKPKSVEAPEPSADVSPKTKTPNLAEEKSNNASAKGKKSSASSDFAKFEKVPTPVAFVKKALVKASAGTPSRKTDMVIKSTPELTASEKKVKFNMKRNTAQKFEDSMTISPLPAFLPAKSPVQGILKSPATPPATPLGTRTPGSKKNRRRKLTSPVESKQDNTPVLMLSSKTVEPGSNPKESGIKSKNTPNKKTHGTPMTKRKSLQLEKNLETPKSRKKSLGGNELSTPQMTPKSAKKIKKMHSTPDTEMNLKKTPKSGKKVTKSNSETPKVGKKNSKIFTPKSTPKTPGDKRSQASDFF